MTPAISILIPVYNTARYLPACLDSVLSQSMPDFEVVAVNDASTDDSPRILREYAARDPRIRIVDHDHNKGLLAARVTGIRTAQGQYIQFLDSDDELLPDILKNVFQTAEEQQADIVHYPLDVRQRDSLAVSGNPEAVRKKSLPGSKILQGEDIFRNFFVDDAYIWMVCQKFYRADLCRKAVEFIPDRFCLMAEDFCFYSIFAFLAERYVPLYRPGYIYYLDSGISSGKKTSAERFLNRQSPFQALRNVRDFLQKQNVWEKYRQAFARQEQKLLGEYVLRWMRHLPDEDRMTAFNGMFRTYDAFPLFQAFRTFFRDKDERFLEMLSGEDPDPV
ncbi:MAG: glycosyltransferase family 2 protein, partial [Lentisphaeria bacterium]|nr:glycosyltransferase family 2 protein [Lentisphaeria bacterium]